MPAAGAHIFICQATKGCYYTLTVYQGFLIFHPIHIIRFWHYSITNSQKMEVHIVKVYRSFVLPLQEATELAKKARELKKTADALHQEERSGGKGRKWRKNVKAVEKVYLHILVKFAIP